MTPDRARPMRPADRFRALRALLDTACRAAPPEADHAAPSERLVSALAACRLDVVVEGVELSASVTQDLCLNVDVRAREGLSEANEQALRRAVEASSSPLASLVLAEWHRFHDAFRAVSLASPRSANSL